MCIAIANMKNKPLSDEEITNCWTNNPDGGGLLYKENGILKVYKNLDNLPKFLKKYKEVIQKSSCLVHFRVTTGGGVTVKNCHPFLVNKSLGFIHNGVISGYSNKAPDKSDTYSFNELVLKGLPKGFQDNTAVMKMMLSYIGGGSKLAFMDKDENFTIIGEDRAAAHFSENGNWYSNRSYEKVNNYKLAGNTKVYNNSCSMPPVKLKKAPSEPDASNYRMVQMFDHEKSMYIQVKAWRSIIDAPKAIPTEWNNYYKSYVQLTPSQITERSAALERKIKKSELKLLESKTSSASVDGVNEAYYEVFDMVPHTEWFGNDLLIEQRVKNYIVCDEQGSLMTTKQACEVIADYWGCEFNWSEIFKEYNELNLIGLNL